jgi:FtsZ-interacting cell division protein YlmF
MAGILSKFWNLIGLGDEEELEEEFEEETTETTPTVVTPAPAPRNFETRSEGVRVLKTPPLQTTPSMSGAVVVNPSPNQNFASSTNKVVSMPPKGNVAMNTNENSRLVVYAPNRFEEVQVLVDHMKANRPVIVSLEGLDSDLARSMLDFICGATYALEGSMQKVSGNIFLVAPSDVDVSSNLKEALLARDSLVRNRDEKGEKI